MKKTKTTKVLSCLLVVVFLNSTLFPSVSWALTNGPSQREFQGFEPIGTSDMVDLKTGDMTYGIPLISIPGPNGDFSMPLSYHSGVGLETEASWVGLGWSLNPGVIARNVSQFPDDFHGQSLVNTMVAEGSNGFAMNFFGIYQGGWDSEKGNSGSVGLSNIFRVGYGSQSGFTALGVNYNSHTGTVTANPFQVGMAVLSVVTMSLGSNVQQSTAPYASQMKSAFTVGNAAISVVSGGLNSSSISVDDWNLKEWGFWVKYYKYNLDASRTDKMYGSLYLGDMENSDNPLAVDLSLADGTFNRLYVQNNSESSPNYAKIFNNDQNVDEDIVSDMHYHVSGNYGQTTNPTSIAYDNYQVMGQGISGPISPYRTDIGSVSYPHDINGNGINAVPFLEALNNSTNKVDFYYKGELANNYQYHATNGSSLGFHGETYNWGSSSTALNMKVTDPYFYSVRNEPNRSDGSLINNKLVKGRNVQWFTNKEITNNIAKAKGFISKLDRTGLPEYGIGGFMITAENGTTYHYSIPVYNKSYFTKSQQASASDYATGSIQDDYATTWLLTAITGADFVDRASIGTSGQLDETDWGYWVELDYGKFSSEYKYRFPYLTSDLSPHPDGSNGGVFTEGTKEIYYLNSISTKTHIGLFIKDVRQDGRGSYTSTSNPASSMYLKEIVVLAKEDYRDLVASTSSGGQGFTIASSNNLNLVETSVDDLDQVLDLYDIASDGTSQTAIRTFLDQKQLNRTKFNFDYSLCTNSQNSFSSATSPPSYSVGGTGGKLTLKSIEILGKNNNKLIPDYDFDYSSNNPNYNRHNWDGWGMYAPDGTSDKSTHYASSSLDNWHLTEINLPTGGILEVEYERDEYSSVSGDPVEVNLEGSSFTSTNGTLVLPVLEDVDMTKEGIYIGMNLTLEAEVLVNGSPHTPPILQNRTISVTVSAVNSNNIEVSGLSFEQGDESMTIKNLRIPVIYNIGGNLRVSKISITDEFNESMETAYIYTKDGTPNGISSGVVSIEPLYIRPENNLPDYYNYYDYSSTGVIYGKVTALNNYKSENDYLSKSIYEFVTPHKSMISITKSGSDYLVNGDSKRIVKAYDIDVEVNTASIGQLKSITNLNSFDEFTSSVSYEFADNANSKPYGDLGLYTEGSILTDKYIHPGGSGTWDTYNHMLRTTKTYKPSIPQAVVFKDNTAEKRVLNTKYDATTGVVLETEYYDAWGSKFRTQTVPAYTLSEYAAMGSKTTNSSYKNMMNQLAGQYLYSYNDDGTQTLVGASVTTWNNDWSYRELSTSGNTSSYSDVSYTDEIFRTHQNYGWESELNPDGTFANFTAFDYSPTASNTNWRKQSEVTEYDHYSRIMEVEDIYGIKASNLYDVSGNFNLMSAANAGRGEIAFTGLELPPVNNLLADGMSFNNTDALISTEFAHTGTKSLRVNGAQGMIAEIDLQSEDYIINTWIHSTNWQNAKLVADLYVGSASSPIQTIELSASNAQVLKAGDWYLLSADISTGAYPTATRMKVYVKNSSPNSGTPIYADDFKCNPLESGAICTVYDPETHRVTATLNADHIAKVFEYDGNGGLKRVKQEVGDNPNYTGGMKTVQEYFHNYGKN
tara:strand:- start:9596 stop:14374 length:4779 start_codon:yes stop_codon:yes gene_type:complete